MIHETVLIICFIYATNIIVYHILSRFLHFFLFHSKDDFRWIREVFMSSTIGFRRMGRKLDMEKDDGFTLHLLERDSHVGGVTSHNVVGAIDHSKRVIIILSA